MSRAAGSLERSLAALTIGVHQSTEQRRRALADGFTGEHLQHVQVPLSGLATENWVHADRDVSWDMAFLSARSQRRVPFEQPQFTHGIEFTSPLTDLVVVHATLTSWSITDQGWYVGANVRFASGLPPILRAVDDTTERACRWSAIAHLTFQGYATYTEGDDFQT